MMRKVIILRQMLVCVCSTKVSDASECKKYTDSAVNKHCKELVVKNGDVCYVWRGHNWKKAGEGWSAKITCKDGFRLIGPSDNICQHHTRKWANSTQESVCELVFSDKDGSESVQIAIPTTVILLIVLVVILFLCWRRKRTPNACPTNQLQKPTTCEELTPPEDIAEYSHIDIAIDVETEHRAIPNISSTCDNEYDTLHMNGSTRTNTNGHQIQIHTSNDNDTYSHATNAARVFQEDESDYSHLDEREHRRLRWNKDTDNVYNTFSQNIEVNVNADKKTYTYYHHTGTHRDKSSVIDHDTYAHVNNG